MTDITTWLDGLGLGKYAQAFTEQDITPDLLPDLTDADLRELGVTSLGDRKRLLKAAAGPVAAPAATETAAPAAARAPVAVQPALAAADVRSAAPSEEGERRHATVMFSDLTGYTALNEAFDPEEVEAIMSRIKREASAVIERHGGRVNQFVGDEVMAMFGIPLARRDDSRRAIRAALELHHIVDEIAAGVAERLGRQLSMHTGLHTGLVIARRSDSRSGDYTLTGDTVNTAARLRGLAKPGEVVVSPQTWQHVSDHFEAETGQPVEVKGKERPLVPYRILGERAVPKGGLRALVGRAEEMQQFEALVHACLSRQRGRVLFVRGDPGLGKSRLVAEFLDVARERGMVGHATTILDFGARTGHDAVRALVQSMLGLAPDADENSRGEAIAASDLNAADGSELTPFLYDLLDVAPPPPVRALLSALESDSRRQSTVDAIGQVVRQQVGQAPMLLLIEDIHWADEWALRQLGAWLSLAASMQLLVVFTTRFSGDPSVGTWRSMLHSLPVSSMDLAPLATDDAMRLAAGAASISDALLRSCVERAEGNPLFLEQLLLNAGDESATSLPGSIQALIQARTDRLPVADKNALQAAAVWGQRAPLAVIRHLVGDPAFDPRLLVDQFLLRPDGDDLVFCHALIRDGAYASLLHARRRQLHQAAGAWIAERDAALAAEHFERGDDPRAAAAYLKAHDERARRFQFVDALQLVERGLGLKTEHDQGFALQLARSRLLLTLGRSAEAITASDAALEVATTDAQQALGLIAKASGMRIVDRVDEGFAVLAEAQPLAERAGLTEDLSRLHELRGNLLFVLGRTDECLHEHERALVLAREAGSAEAECAALGGIGDAIYSQGKVRTGARMFEQCVAMAHEQGFMRVKISYLPMIGWTHLYQLELPAALEVCKKAIDLAVRMTHRRVEMMARLQTVMIDGFIRCNHARVRPDLDRALELVQMMGSRRFEGLTWYFRGLLDIVAGDRDAAREDLRQADAAGLGDSGFAGPQVMGLRALLADNDAERNEALAQGEVMLRGNVLSHNHFIFYDIAMRAAIGAGEWDQALRYCDQLEAFCAQEPFEWADFIVARGRALVRAARGDTGPELDAELQRLLAQARDKQMNFYLTDIEKALAHRAPATA